MSASRSVLPSYLMYKRCPATSYLILSCAAVLHSLELLLSPGAFSSPESDIGFLKP
jgi:hypothetical protein